MPEFAVFKFQMSGTSEDTMRVYPPSLFIVGSVPPGEITYAGGTALSIPGGAVLMVARSLYRLSCSSSNCAWTKMERELQQNHKFGVMMKLPKEYLCSSKSMIISYALRQRYLIMRAMKYL